MLDSAVKEQLKTVFASLERKVVLSARPSGHEKQAELRELLSGVAEASPRITAREEGEAAAGRRPPWPDRDHHLRVPLLHQLPRRGAGPGPDGGPPRECPPRRGGRRRVGSGAVVRVSGGERFAADALIVATGAKWRELGVSGEKEHIGRGFAFCPHCDGPFFSGKRVAVVGGGNSGVEAALSAFEDRMRA